MVIKKKKDNKNVNENVNIEIPEDAEVIELDQEALEALMGGCSPVAQSFNYTWLDSFDMEDLDERRLYINYEIDESLIDEIGYHIMRYNRLDKGKEVKERTPIIIYINTFGGSLHAANTIISMINSSKTPVYTVNLGLALSAGFLIFIAGHKRYSLESGIFMLHDGQNMYYNSLGKIFNAVFFDKEVIEKKIKEYVLEKTSITSKLYDKKYHQDWYMDTQKASELGVCDYIVGENCTLDDILN